METPSFDSVFALAFSAFFKILFNGRFAPVCLQLTGTMAGPSR